jgi:hypothetical protein
MPNPIWGSWPDIYYCLTVTVLFLSGALSDERTGLSFIYADPRQRSLSRVPVPCDSSPYFTLSGLRLPFSSPPTTRRVTVEVFEPAPTRVSANASIALFITPLHGPSRKRRFQNYLYFCMRNRCIGNVYLEPLHRNGSTSYIIIYT